MGRASTPSENDMLLALFCCLTIQEPAQEPEPEPEPELGAADVQTAGGLIGLDFTDDEAQMMLRDVRRKLASLRSIRAVPLDNSVPPALGFTPLLPGIEPRLGAIEARELVLPEVERPDDLEQLAFAGIPELASLIRARKVSCVELARMYLARLKRLDQKLLCVISLTEERALEQAALLDEELAAGHWRGPLHGIPYGAKDLFAVRGYRTTWGARPYQEQVLECDATVIERLDAAGAVLIAKLSLGALAMGDVWFGGTTRNPWEPERGSSGSSAGSACATAAGCVAFALGSETLGSIVSPSERCGTSSLRPTFGRVPRSGAMALSWSMDKIGPLCRSVADAALVFDAIRGPDGKDPSAVAMPFTLPVGYRPAGTKVGFSLEAFERSERHQPVLEQLEQLGCELVPVELPDFPARSLLIILDAEAAAAFDELTRSGRDDLLVRQEAGAWPNSFRAARLIPAVEYINANRLRTLLCREMHAALSEVDLYVHPSFGDGSLTITNLTGHPVVVAPAGFSDDGTPFGVSFTGQLYDEARLLAVATAWQEATGFHRRHPDL